MPETGGVSQSRVKLFQSHYFKHTTSSSAAEVLFQSPVYLEIRARRTPFGEISSVHMSRLRDLKIPTMLCAQTNFPKSVAENVSYDAHLHTCSPVPLVVFRMPGSILASLLKQVTRKSCATKQAYSRLRNTLCLKPEPSLLWLVSWPALLWLVNHLEMSRPMC